MTTIAWDGQSVAADRGAWVDEVCVPVNKLRVKSVDLDGNGELIECAIAGMGCRPFVEAMIKHLATGAPMPPASAYDMNGTNDCLFVLPKGRRPFTMTAVGERIEVFGDFHACGGGRSFALGVLAHGGSALEAVQLAAIYTDYAKHGVDCVRF